jgi:hypothetical protein
MKTYRSAVPLALLVICLSLGLGITVAAREVSAQAGFLVERQAVLLVWLAGLLITGAAFVWAAGRSLRRADSAASLWILILTASVLAAPLLLMLLQHPSP